MFRHLPTSCLIVLCGCGGSTTGGGGAADAGGGLGGVTLDDPYLSRLEYFTAQQQRVLGDADKDGLPELAVFSEPMGGQVTYAGQVSIGVSHPNRQLAIFGDAALTFDFAEGIATGKATDFFGTTLAGQVAPYAGVVALTAQSIAPRMDVGFDGALSGPATVTLGGALDGQFFGSQAQAFVASALDTTVNFDGFDRPTTVVLILEETP